MLFDPETKTVFKPAGKERLGNRQTLLYDFTVPKESSKLVSQSRRRRSVDRRATAAPSGSDAETKKVLRIDQAIDDLPKSYPVTHSESSVDYDIVKLRGLDVDFLLPTRAEFIIGDRRKKRHYLAT